MIYSLYVPLLIKVSSEINPTVTNKFSLNRLCVLQYLKINYKTKKFCFQFKATATLVVIINNTGAKELL